MREHAVQDDPEVPTSTCQVAEVQDVRTRIPRIFEISGYQKIRESDRWKEKADDTV